MLSAALLLLAGPAAAYPPLLQSRQGGGGFPGIATFNNYAGQGGTTCGPLAGTAGTYGAAASDISPDISGGKCESSPTGCQGYGPPAGFQPPQCPKTNCGKCYKVTNEGGVDGGSIGGVGNVITVQIIDACPSGSAQNFCKTNVPANQRCGDPGTNQLDIDTPAYQALTGQPFGNGPTLKISISPSDCAGGSTSGDSGDPSGGSDPSSSTTQPSSGTVQPDTQYGNSTQTYKKSKCKRSSPSSSSKKRNNRYKNKQRKEKPKRAS